MSGKWAESETRTFNLPEDNPDTFALWLNFVYTNQIPVMATEDYKELNNAEFPDAISHEYRELGKLYVLSEKLQDISAKNVTLLAILEVCKQKDSSGGWNVPTPSVIGIIYEGTVDGSPARRLVTDIWTSAKKTVLNIHFNSLPKEFYRDLSFTLINMKANIGNPAKDSDGSQYLEK